MVRRPKIVAAFSDELEHRYVAIDEDGQCWIRESESSFDKWEQYGDPIPLPATIDAAPQPES